MKDKVIFTLERREVILLVVVLLVFALSLFFLGFLAGYGKCKKVATVSEPQKVERIVVTPDRESSPGVEYTFVTTGGVREVTVSDEENVTSVEKGEEAPPVSATHTEEPEKKASPSVEKRAEKKQVTEKKTGKKSAPVSSSVKVKTPRKEKVASPPVKMKKPYTVQVAAYRSKKDALLLVYKLKKAGFDAFYERTNIPGKGVWYRVRVGHYSSRDEAKRWADKIHRRMGLPTFVTIAR